MNYFGKQKILDAIFWGNIITLVIPVALIAFFITMTLFNYFNNDIARKDNIIALNMKKNVDSFLNEAVNTLEYIEIGLDDSDCAKNEMLIDEINEVNQYFENIEVIDRYGIVTHTLNKNVSQLGLNRSGEEYFQYIQENNVNYWSKPFISPVSGKPTVTIALPKGSIIIVGYLNLDYLNRMTKKNIAALGEGVEVALVDRYGIYISSDSMDLVMQRQMEPNFDEIKDMLFTDQTHLHFDYGEKEYMVVAAKLFEPNWYLIIYDDYNYAFRTASLLLKLFLALFLTSVIAFVLVSSIRARRISAYMNDFIKTTEMIANGDFKASFGQLVFYEFDKLARNIESMVMSLKDRDAALAQMAYHDMLTGLSNRAYLYEQNLWNQNSYKEKGAIGLIYLDIDNFKIVNDTYGHPVGDLLLIELSHRISQCIDSRFLFARLGGDEFVILVPSNLTDTVEIERTIETILKNLKEPIALDDKSIFVTVSMGISIDSNQEHYDVNTQLKNADTALYVAKDQGKNRFVHYTSLMDEKNENRMRIEQNMRNGLENNEFSLVYQPFVYGVNGTLRGFEALLRWNNPILGRVSPDDFIAVAEETGMILKIGEWVLKTAGEAIRCINEAYQSDYIMAVNVSPVEIVQGSIVSNLSAMLEEKQIKPQWLEIEITESVFIDNTEDVLVTLDQLREIGIRLSLDDFGTGYSSLSYLKKLPCSTLKIDRAFIKDIQNETDSRKMVESIIVMAHKLGAEVVAEGVEENEQQLILNGLECDLIQGYLVCRPIELDRLMNFIEEHEEK